MAAPLWVETSTLGAALLDLPLLGDYNMFRIQSLVVLMLATSTAAAAQQSRASAYHDPNGRFSVAVPAGWTAAPQGDGVVIKQGATYVLITPVEGAGSSQDVVATLSKQFGSQWRSISTVNQGDFTFARGPASYVTYAGTNPRGVTAMLGIIGFMHGSDAYAFVFSGPRDGFGAAQDGVGMIQSSFSFSGRSGSTP
ncbi:MAG: hypothetical protein ACR2MQ_07400 [Gemmatimonadaceae bacterium]